MKPALTIAVVLLCAGCALKESKIAADSRPMPPGGPDWTKVDESAARAKAREESKPRLVETQRTEERGYLKMTDEEYAKVLACALDEVRRANPSWSELAVETEARKRADQAKWDQENSYTVRSSSTYEWKSPEARR